MEARKLLDALHVAEKLKDETRHCTTTKGAPENVASHSWRMALMAYFMTDEFPALDMDKVIKMCLIHDLGECFTGDIPTFRKTQADEDRETKLLSDWVKSLPEPFASQMTALDAEMDALEKTKARYCSYMPPSSSPHRRGPCPSMGFCRCRWQRCSHRDNGLASPGPSGA